MTILYIILTKHETDNFIITILDNVEPIYDFIESTSKDIDKDITISPNNSEIKKCIGDEGIKGCIGVVGPIGSIGLSNLTINPDADTLTSGSSRIEPTQNYTITDNIVVSDRESPYISNYYRTAQSYAPMTSSRTSMRSLYTPYSLYSSSYQPSGSVNVSRTDPSIINISTYQYTDLSEAFGSVNLSVDPSSINISTQRSSLSTNQYTDLREAFRKIT